MSEEQISNEISKIIEGISKLNLTEVSKLIEGIKEKYDIKDTAVIQPGNTVQAGEKSEEKVSNVSMKLVDIGPQRVQIYNIIRTAIKELKGTEINIVETKKLTEAEGGTILENIPGEKAELVKKQLEEKGAKVEIK